MFRFEVLVSCLLYRGRLFSIFDTIRSSALLDTDGIRFETATRAIHRPDEGAERRSDAEASWDSRGSIWASCTVSRRPACFRMTQLI